MSVNGNQSMGSPLLLHVVEVVSEVEDVDPLELKPPLEPYVSMDALKHLGNHESSSWELPFDYLDHEMSITSNGWISVDGDQVRRWKAAEVNFESS